MLFSTLVLTSDEDVLVLERLLGVVGGVHTLTAHNFDSGYHGSVETCAGRGW